jgi:hypothetical protein
MAGESALPITNSRIMESWIAKMCRRRVRRQILAWALILLAGIAFLLFNGRYARNFVEGPYKLAPNELAQITDAETTHRYFVSVVGEKVLDTGIQEVTTTTRNGVKEGSQVSAGYYALVVGDRFLIVKSAGKPPEQTAGELTPFPSDLSSQLFSGVDGRELQMHSYPFYLDTEGFRYPGYWAIGIAWVLFGLFWKFGRPAWIRSQDINKHPLVKRVEQWGDPVGISVNVQREIDSSVRHKSNGILITDNYVVRRRFFSFNILRFDDLLWTYKKVTKRSVNFIPTGKSFDAIMIFYGGSETFSGNEARVGEVLTLASNRAPWAVVGYSTEIKDLFSKRTDEFCQFVETRRQELSKRAL